MTKPELAQLLRAWPNLQEQARTPYQPKTGEPCHCKPGVERDNCPDCEGTGMRIDFVAIRNRNARNANQS